MSTALVVLTQGLERPPRSRQPHKNASKQLQRVLINVDMACKEQRESQCDQR